MRISGPLIGWEQRAATVYWGLGGSKRGLTTLLTQYHRSERPHKSHFIEEKKEMQRGERQSVPGPGLEPDPLSSQGLFSLVNPLVLWSLHRPGLEPVSLQPALD